MHLTEHVEPLRFPSSSPPPLPNPSPSHEKLHYVLCMYTQDTLYQMGDQVNYFLFFSFPLMESRSLIASSVMALQKKTHVKIKYCTRMVCTKPANMHTLYTCTLYTHAHFTHIHTLYTCTLYTHTHFTHMHTLHTCTLYTHADMHTCTLYTHAHTHPHITHNPPM